MMELLLNNLLLAQHDKPQAASIDINEPEFVISFVLGTLVSQTFLLEDASHSDPLIILICLIDAYFSLWFFIFIFNYQTLCLSNN